MMNFRTASEKNMKLNYFLIFLSLFLQQSVSGSSSFSPVSYYINQIIIKTLTILSIMRPRVCAILEL